ncbi:MAG: hypothetical protein CMM50_06365 [Rhodospirillaceae bacterium]|nr:hypothetical protein [Rhodospirillaceae bacterium]
MGMLAVNQRVASCDHPYMKGMKMPGVGIGRVVAACMMVGLLAFAPRIAAAEDLSKDQIEEMIHLYILDHPEVILDSVRAYSEKQEAAAKGKVKERLVALRDQLHTGPSAGNPDADVTMVEFFDYRCGYCKKSLPTVVEMLEKDPNLRIVFKDYPILSPESKAAAKAAIAADKQGKYFEMHNALMASRGSFTDEQIMEIAAEVGLDTDKLAADMNSPETEAILAENMALAGELGINGTPTFIVHDTLVPGAMDIETMKHVIEEARANS